MIRSPSNLGSLSRTQHVLQLPFSEKDQLQNSPNKINSKKDKEFLFSSYSSEFVGGNHEHYSEKTFLVTRSRTIDVLTSGHEDFVLVEDGLDEYLVYVEMHVT